jgi:glycosyltransferase involved in cell wall biosynthesis
LKNNLSPLSERRTRILFLAWGFSIHAKRRIQICVDDPSFEVGVVSTYNYDFEHTRNFLLHTHQQETIKSHSFTSGNKSKSFRYLILKIGRKLKSIINEISVIVNSPFILKAILRPKNSKILKSFLLSSEIRFERIRAYKDLKIFKSALKEFKPNIISLQTLLYPCYLAFSLPRFMPIMITFWNGDVTWWAEWQGTERLLKKEIVKHGITRAKAITVNSQVAYDKCIEYGAQADKLHLIRYPGVDLERFRPLSKDEARKKLQLNSDKVVLCPRGLGQYLNSEIIVESAAKVVNKYPDTLFLFISGVGYETELEKHKQLAESLGIETKFRWIGQVAWDDMGMYYNASDVMVSISSNDSLPNCMLEAMACGVPVVMGDIPSIREWVKDAFNGYLVPPRNPVALSKRILDVFEDTNTDIKLFVERNLERVKRDADSKKKIKQIKNLIHSTARLNKK